MTSLKPVSLTVLTLAMMSASAATAQTTPVDEIVVTGKYLYADKVNALKSPTPIIDVPQSLSIVTADQIIQQGFTSIGDIINYTPGVNTSQGEGHRDAVVFRGVRSTADFFIDGVRDDVQYYRPLYNLDQVEILRGPNALLFGRGGTGGILNRVTKKALIGDSFTGYKASLDTFGAFDIQLDRNFATSESSALRINAYYEGLNNHRDFFDGDRIGINPTAKFQLTPSTVLDVSYEYVDNKRFVDRGVPTGADGRPVEDLDDIVFGDSELNSTELEAHILRAKLNHKFSDNLKGVFSAAYSDFDKLYQNFYAADYDPDTNIVTLDGYKDTTQRKNIMLSGNLIGQFATGELGHTVVAGAEYIDTANNNDRFNAFFSGSQDDQENFFAVNPLGLVNGSGVNALGDLTVNDFTVDLNDDTEADVKVMSAYIQDEIALSDMFDIIVGARFDSFDITVDNVEDFIDTGARNVRSRKDEKVSPRFGLVFKPEENISLYGSYSESFLPRSGEQFANLPGNDALDANEYINLEAGLKWDFFNGLSLTAAIFEIEESSPSVDDNPVTNPSGDTTILTVIDTTTQGFETQLQGLITKDWHISAGYSYLDGEQNNGLRKRELPKHTVSLWNNYQLTDQFGVGVGLTYQGKSFINNSNSAVLPSYTRFDAAAFYDVSDALRLQVNVENLTDTQYFPNSHSTHQVTVGAPFNARFTISGRF